MPIRESEKSRYPANWREISRTIRLRNNGCCEWCDAPNGVFIIRLTDIDPTGKVWAEVVDDGSLPLPDADDMTKVVLTVAHLDHMPENNDPRNLASLCQWCHNRYDAPHRAAGRKARRVAAQHDGADLFAGGAA